MLAAAHNVPRPAGDHSRSSMPCQTAPGKKKAGHSCRPAAARHNQRHWPEKTPHQASICRNRFFAASLDQERLGH